VLSLRGLVSPTTEGGPSAPAPEGAEAEGVDAAPDLEGTSDLSESPSLPFSMPSAVDEAGAATAAAIEALLRGGLEYAASYLNNPASMPELSRAWDGRRRRPARRSAAAAHARQPDPR
jgi:hypothetical protein